MSEPGKGVNVERVLCRAHDLLSEGHWVRGDLAVDNRGCSVEPNDDYAVNFCSIGALQRARHELSAEYSVYNEAVERLAAKMRPHGSYFGTPDELQTPYVTESIVVNYNDRHARSGSDVVGLFCETIKQTREDYGLEQADGQE